MTPDKFTIRGPQPLYDGHRQFQGRAQLSAREQQVLDDGRRFGIRIYYEAGEQVLVCGKAKLRRETILRLLQLKYLIPAADGLFGEDTAQTLLVNVTR